MCIDPPRKASPHTLLVNQFPRWLQPSLVRAACIFYTKYEYIFLLQHRQPSRLGARRVVTVGYANEICQRPGLCRAGKLSTNSEPWSRCPRPWHFQCMFKLLPRVLEVHILAGIQSNHGLVMVTEASATCNSSALDLECALLLRS